MFSDSYLCLKILLLEDLDKLVEEETSWLEATSWLAHLCMSSLSLQSCLTLCDPMDHSLQAPLFLGFSRQEYWSGLPCPPPADLS